MWISEHALNLLIQRLEEADKAITAEVPRDKILAAQTDIFLQLGIKDKQLIQQGLSDMTNTLAEFKTNMVSLISDYQAGKLSMSEAVASWKDMTGKYYVDMFKAGARSMGNPYFDDLTDHDIAFINKARRFESGFFKKFLMDIDNPDHVPVHPYLQRAEYYADSAKAQFYNGMVAGAGKNVIIFWVLGSSEHCDDCLDLASGNPYTWDTLPTTPKAGDTECIYNCKCHLEIQASAPPGLGPVMPAGPESSRPSDQQGRWARVTDANGNEMTGSILDAAEDLYQDMYKARQMISVTDGAEKEDWITRRQQLNRELVQRFDDMGYRVTPTMAVKDLIDVARDALAVAPEGIVTDMSLIKTGAEVVFVRANYMTRGVLQVRGGHVFIETAEGEEYCYSEATDIIFLINNDGLRESLVEHGTSASGNWGHEGRPGHEGGSKKGAGGGDLDVQEIQVNVEDLPAEFARIWVNWRQEDKEKMLFICKDGRSLLVSSGGKTEVGFGLKQIDQALKDHNMHWWDLKVVCHNHNEGQAPSQADVKVFRAMMDAGFGGESKIYTPKTGQIRNVPYSGGESLQTEGGPGSGNFDHAGRPGEVGGSGEGGGVRMLHGTNTDVLRSILRQGLVPTHEEHWGHSLYVGERKDAIFVTRSMDAAKSWANKSCVGKHHDADGIILTLRIPKSVTLKPDIMASKNDFYTSQRIRPEWIKSAVMNTGLNTRTLADKWEPVSIKRFRKLESVFETLYVPMLVLKKPVAEGGAGSGNYDHAGRPGEVGGSGPGGGTFNANDEATMRLICRAMQNKLMNQGIVVTFWGNTANGIPYVMKDPDVYYLPDTMKCMRELLSEPEAVKMSISSVKFFGQDAELGEFTAGGQTFRVGGDYASHEGEMRVKLGYWGLDIFHHEMGHAEFQALQSAAIKGVDQRQDRDNGEFDKTFRADGGIKDPTTPEQEALGAVERISSFPFEHDYVSDYAKSWSNEPIVDAGRTYSFKSHEVGLAGEPGGKEFTIDVKVANVHRSSNENFAEIAKTERNEIISLRSIYKDKDQARAARALYRDVKRVLKKVKPEGRNAGTGVWSWR